MWEAILIGVGVAIYVISMVVLWNTIKIRETIKDIQQFLLQTVVGGSITPKRKKYVMSGKYSKKIHRSVGKKPEVGAKLRAYWANMTPDARIKESKRRAMVAKNNKIARAKGMTPPKKRNGWQKKRISKGIKAYWANLTPEEKRIRIDKIRRGKEMKKLLKATNNFHV